MSCRVTDFDRKGLMKRYVGFIQDVVANNPAARDMLAKFAETHPQVKYCKGHMKSKPGEHIYTI